MAFSDIVGGFTKSYLYTNLARDAVKLWNRLGDVDLLDIDKEALLRKVGVVPYAPARRTAPRSPCRCRAPSRLTPRAASSTARRARTREAP